MANIKVLSLNVRQWSRDRDKTSPFYWKTRMEKIAEMIKEQNPDILCLQELTFPATRYIPEEYRRVTWGVSHSIWAKMHPADVHGHGWRIFADYADLCKETIEYYGQSYQTFRIINVHGRWNSWARKWMLRIFDKWRWHCPTIAMGDFNNTYEQMEESLLTYWEGCPLNEDTFENFINPASHGEIDLCLHSPAITLKKLSKVEWKGPRASDHWPIIGEFEV